MMDRISQEFAGRNPEASPWQGVSHAALVVTESLFRHRNSANSTDSLLIRTEGIPGFAVILLENLFNPILGHRTGTWDGLGRTLGCQNPI